MKCEDLVELAEQPCRMLGGERQRRADLEHVLVRAGGADEDPPVPAVKSNEEWTLRYQIRLLHSAFHAYLK